MRKDIYESPKFLIIHFEEDDAIRTSGDVFANDDFDEKWS